jgi:hypothetical protein
MVMARKHKQKPTRRAEVRAPRDAIFRARPYYVFLIPRHKLYHVILFAHVGPVTARRIPRPHRPWRARGKRHEARLIRLVRGLVPDTCRPPLRTTPRRPGSSGCARSPPAGPRGGRDCGKPVNSGAEGDAPDPVTRAGPTARGRPCPPLLFRFWILPISPIFLISRFPICYFNPLIFK